MPVVAALVGNLITAAQIVEDNAQVIGGCAKAAARAKWPQCRIIFSKNGCNFIGDCIFDKRRVMTRGYFFPDGAMAFSRRSRIL